MNRQQFVGYSNQKGGYNAMSGYAQFLAHKKADLDDDTNEKAVVKPENIEPTDNLPETQKATGDISMEKGDGEDKTFTREKLSDVPTEKVGYNENATTNLKEAETTPEE